MRLFEPDRDPARSDDVAAFADRLVELWSDPSVGRKDARRLMQAQAQTAEGRLLLFFSEKRLEQLMAETRNREFWNIYRGLRQVLFRLARMLPE